MGNPLAHGDTVSLMEETQKEDPNALLALPVAAPPTSGVPATTDDTLLGMPPAGEGAPPPPQAPPARLRADVPPNLPVRISGMRNVFLNEANDTAVRGVSAVICICLAAEGIFLWLSIARLSDKLDILRARNANAVTITQVIPEPITPAPTIAIPERWSDILLIPMLIALATSLAYAVSRTLLLYQEGEVESHKLYYSVRMAVTVAELGVLIYTGVKVGGNFGCEPESADGNTSCDEGGTLTMSMWVWGVYSILRWVVLLGVRLYKHSGRAAQQEVEPDDTVNPAREPKLQQQYIKEDQSPIVMCLQVARDTAFGAVLCYNSADVQDRFERVTDSSWSSVLAPLILVTAIGTFLSFAMLVPMGCPTSLEREDDVPLTWLRRACWNTTIPLFSALYRLGFVMLLIFAAEFSDHLKYGEQGSHSPDMVLMCVRYLFGVTAAASGAFAVCAGRPSLLRSLATAAYVGFLFVFLRALSSLGFSESWRNAKKKIRNCGFFY